MARSLGRGASGGAEVGAPEAAHEEAPYEGPGGPGDPARGEEARLLAELRRELQAELEAAPAFPELVGDRRLLRTLRACGHVVPEAADAFREHLGKRQEFGLDAVRGHIAQAWGAQASLPLHDLPKAEHVSRYLPQVMPFAFTPKGDPISLHFWGLWRTADFIKEVDDWKEVFKVHACYQLEARALLIDCMSQEQGRLVHIVNVHDLKGWSMMSHVDSTFLAFQREEMLPLAATYHNFSSHVFFINTSRWFHLPFNLFLPLLPRHTQEKISLHGDAFGDSPRLCEELGRRALEALARPHDVAPATAAGVPPVAGSDLAPEAGSVDSRAYFGLRVARAGAEVELQSWLHSAVLEPLASRQELNEFRVLWTASQSAATSSTLLVFELSAPGAWPTPGDPEASCWQWRLQAAGLQLLGPARTAAELARQAHEPGEAGAAGEAGTSGLPRRAGRRGWPWPAATESLGALLLHLALFPIFIWASWWAQP